LNMNDGEFSQLLDDDGVSNGNLNTSGDWNVSFTGSPSVLNGNDGGTFAQLFDGNGSSVAIANNPVVVDGRPVSDRFTDIFPNIADNKLTYNFATDGTLVASIPVNNGSWTNPNMRGNSGWVSNSQDILRITGGQPVQYRGGFADFSPWKRGEVDINRIQNRRTDRRNADREYARQQGWFRSNGTPDRQRAADFRTNNDLRWHHVEYSTKTQLIPRVVHDLNHRGGFSTRNVQVNPTPFTIPRTGTNSSLNTRIPTSTPTSQPIPRTIPSTGSSTGFSVGGGRGGIPRFTILLTPK
jgi:hypothetical protein